MQLKKGATEFPPHQSWSQRVCPGGRLILALLALIGLMGLLTVVFGLTETDDLKKLAKLDEMVKHLTDEMNQVKSDVQGKVTGLRNTLKTVNCDLQNVKRNKTGTSTPCCPVGWDSFSRSCYWVSKTEKPWDEAKADCEDKEARLVTITSYLEQQFVAQRTKPRYTWIGLSYTNGNWKWVDGTSYNVRRIDWKPGLPYSFPMTTGELVRCAYLHRDGLWSEGHCTHQRYSWVCEINLKG